MPPVATAEAVVLALEDSREGMASPRLAAMGSVEELAPHLVAVRLSRPGEGPRQSWKNALSSCQEAWWAAPVLRDEAGREMFPIGSVTIRFQRRLAGAPLGAFAREQGLEIEKTNEYVPEQVTFRPLKPREVYLPDLATRLESLPSVRKAWLGTASHYSRG